MSKEQSINNLLVQLTTGSISYYQKTQELKQKQQAAWQEVIFISYNYIYSFCLAKQTARRPLGTRKGAKAGK
jgi:hypothetical protein